MIAVDGRGRNSWRRLSAALLVALAAAACGGGDDGDDRADTVRDTAAAADSEGTSPSTSAAPAEDIESMALELDDMPTGWTVSDSDSDDEDDSDDGDSDMAEDCGLENEILPEVDPAEEAERSFQKAEMGPFVFQVVGRFDDGKAAEVMEALRTMVDSCREFTTTEDDGSESTGSFEPVSFPTYGDDTFAARMSLQGQGFMAEGDLVAVRQGDHAILHMGMQATSLLGTSPFADGEFEQIVETAVQKAFG